MIRPARTEDVPALADLARRTWLDAVGASVSPENAAAEAEEGRSEERVRAALAERTILVAEETGALVGYVEFAERSCAASMSKGAPRTRHRRALLDAALTHPRLARADRVVLQVWDENVRAVRLYESVGFVRTGTQFTIGDDVVEDAVPSSNPRRAEHA